jgi:hypothetical protein
MDPIESSLAPDGLISSLPSTTLKRSVLACSLGLQSGQGLIPKTYSGSAATTAT